MNEIVRDNGWKSKKLWFSVGCITAMFGGAILTGLWAPFGPAYSTLVGGIEVIAGLFLTGHVATAWVGSKVAPDGISSIKQGVDREKPIMPTEDEEESK